MRSPPTLTLVALMVAAVADAAPPPGPGMGGPPPGPGMRPPPPPGPGLRPPPPGGWSGSWSGGWPGGWYGGYPRVWRPGVGVYVGAPWVWPGWAYSYPAFGWGVGYGWGAAYGWPYVPATPVVVGSVPNPTIVVQSAPVQTAAASYWYYCTQPAGYFPYVQNCEQPWMKVVPQVPGESNAPPRPAP